MARRSPVEGTRARVQETAARVLLPLPAEAQVAGPLTGMAKVARSAEKPLLAQEETSGRFVKVVPLALAALDGSGAIPLPALRTLSGEMAKGSAPGAGVKADDAHRWCWPGGQATRRP